jgi:PAS domain S-box-containing protein
VVAETGLMRRAEPGPDVPPVDFPRDGVVWFRMACAHAVLGMTVRSIEGRFLYVNPGFCAMTGYSEAQLLATDYQSITHPDDLPTERTAVARLLEGTEGLFALEKRYVRKDGELAWVTLNATLVRDSRGRPDHIVALVQDVSASRRAEAAVRDSEQSYRELVETAREMIVTVDLEGRFTSMNAAFETLTGWSAQEWVGRTFHGLIHPDDLAACMTVFEASMRGETVPSVTHRISRPDGQWLVVESTGTAQRRGGRVVGVLGIARDVSARVRAEQALAESRHRLQAIFDNARDAILIANDEARYVDANAAATELLGYTREELLARTAWDLTPPADRQRAAETLASFQAHGAYAGGYRLQRKDGIIREAEFRSVANILPGLHLAVVRDVTERKEAEADLRRRERLFEEAEAVAQVGCWEWDLVSGSLIWSAQLYRLFGVSAADFKPGFDAFLERVHPEDRAMVAGVNERALAGDGSFFYDARIVRPTGEIRFVHVRGHGVKEASGQLVRLLGIAQDVTERKADDELRRRLMSRLLSAHEDERARLSRELHDGPAQALTAILVGLRRVEDAGSLAEARQIATQQRDLVAQVMEDLSRLSHGLRPTALDDIGLVAALEHYTTERARLFGLRVTLEAHDLERLPPEVESGLYRMVQEALSNAARHARAHHVRIALTSDGKAVRLTVEDDGCGFDVENVLQAGQGLGVHGLCDRARVLGGHAEILSRRGEGTTVRVMVPLSPSVAPKKRRRERGRR